MEFLFFLLMGWEIVNFEVGFFLRYRGLNQRIIVKKIFYFPRFDHSCRFQIQVLVTQDFHGREKIAPPVTGTALTDYWPRRNTIALENCNYCIIKTVLGGWTQKDRNKAPTKWSRKSVDFVEI